MLANVPRNADLWSDDAENNGAPDLVEPALEHPTQRVMRRFVRDARCGQCHTKPLEMFLIDRLHGVLGVDTRAMPSALAITRSSSACRQGHRRWEKPTAKLTRTSTREEGSGWFFSRHGAVWRHTAGSELLGKLREGHLQRKQVRNIDQDLSIVSCGQFGARAVSKKTK